MQERTKYPLTPEAKDAAKMLVKAWDNGDIEQFFYLIDTTSGAGARNVQLSPGLGINGNFEIPSLGIIRELGQYKLINLDHTSTSKRDRFEITLLQELRNAVANDFQVSDFFLTISAVGTIIHGNLTLGKDSSFQSGAAGIGDVTFTAETLSDEIKKLLGADANRPEIEKALLALRNADTTPTRFEKAGKVIEELGRGLAHLSNAQGALTAIATIARVFSGGIL